jgi:hypothetical protein
MEAEDAHRLGDVLDRVLAEVLEAASTRFFTPTAPARRSPPRPARPSDSSRAAMLTPSP